MYCYNSNKFIWDGVLIKIIKFIGFLIICVPFCAYGMKGEHSQTKKEQTKEEQNNLLGAQEGSYSKLIESYVIQDNPQGKPVNQSWLGNSFHFSEIVAALCGCCFASSKKGTDKSLSKSQKSIQKYQEQKNKELMIPKEALFNDTLEELLCDDKITLEQLLHYPQINDDTRKWLKEFIGQKNFKETGMVLQTPELNQSSNSENQNISRYTNSLRKFAVHENPDQFQDVSAINVSNAIDMSDDKLNQLLLSTQQSTFHGKNKKRRLTSYDVGEDN